ncbi:TPR-like protein [Malassezia equina]|uniref:ER membrane protein complex subunit 2 n=1 Tax=Malassezia equina TaxID=1381935 RepID=A0AAF0IXY7_9BASI|nr:TPR-like protein [Malassezia equina]
MSEEAPITLDEALRWLEQQRNTLAREPFLVVRYGEWLLEHQQLGALGQDVWAFLEQLGLAAAELGKIDLAELCLSRLVTRFNDSARVLVLKGIILEAEGRFDEAKRIYELLLRKESSNMLVNKRRLACIKASPNGIPLATEGLAELVDIFPTDQESWLELASLYLQQNKYAQAVFALEELVLLAPQNSFYLLKYAETLYTAGDMVHAYKIYLRILELGEGNLDPCTGHKMDSVKGPWVRTLWGLKMDSGVTSVERVDALVTKLLLESVYAPNATPSTPSSCRAAVRAVLTPSSPA